MNKPLSISLLGIALTILLAAAVHSLPIFKHDLSQRSEDAIASDSSAKDRLAHPDKTQTFTNGGYQLTLNATDDWESPTVSAKLYENGTLRWQQTLPHQYGPRFVQLSSAGQTILFDEYINVASDYAITLVDTDGGVMVTYSFDDILRLLQSANPDLTRADITAQATAGWWISGAPDIDGAETYAYIPTSGDVLWLDLMSGELQLSP